MEKVELKKTLTEEEIKKIRKMICKRLDRVSRRKKKKLNLIGLSCSKEVLDKIIFDYYYNNGTKYKKFCTEFKNKYYLEKLDFDGVDFSDFYCESFDFSTIKGININPQTIYAKNLSNAICQGVKFVGPFDGVNLYCTDFTNSKGVKINPQLVCNKDLRGAVCSGVEFTGSFDGVLITDTSFANSKNAKIDPQTVYNKDLRRTNCQDVEFTGSFDDTYIVDGIFDGSNVRFIDDFDIIKKDLKKIKRK